MSLLRFYELASDAKVNAAKSQLLALDPAALRAPILERINSLLAFYAWLWAGNGSPGLPVHPCSTMVLGSDSLCPCRLVVETSGHLLFQCTVSRQLWSRALSLWVDLLMMRTLHPRLQRPLVVDYVEAMAKGPAASATSYAVAWRLFPEFMRAQPGLSPIFDRDRAGRDVPVLNEEDTSALLHDRPWEDDFG
ncbi:hypothetical protein H4R35_001261 [Dimargaris xerosporica]|nr:hypothetical protein H4R35_001261 [Dimargaris xerosporica]